MCAIGELYKYNTSDWDMALCGGLGWGSPYWSLMCEAPVNHYNMFGHQCPQGTLPGCGLTCGRSCLIMARGVGEYRDVQGEALWLLGSIWHELFTILIHVVHGSSCTRVCRSSIRWVDAGDVGAVSCTGEESVVNPFRVGAWAFHPWGRWQIPHWIERTHYQPVCLLAQRHQQ